TPAGSVPARDKIPIMAASDDLETRVTTLETQVQELTEQGRHNAHDAAAARILAGCADRDTTEIRAEIPDFRRATTASFHAMRADFTDLRTEMNNRVDAVDTRFDTVDAKFDAVDTRFDTVDAKFDAVDTRLNAMDNRFDAVDNRFDTVDA